MADAVRTKWEIPGICAALAILVLAVFGQTVRFGFVNFDDGENVYQAREVTAGFSLRGIGWAFTHAQVDRWAPLATISRMIDCQVYGLWAGGHHLTNVLLHALAAVFLFLAARKMTGAMWRSAFVAAVFALHPLHVESVAWVSARADLLCGMFFMLAIWSYATYGREPERRAQYAMSILWFALGLMSKTAIVTLPFLLLALDYWPLGRLRDKSQLGRLLVEKVPFLALSVAASAAAVLAQGRGVLKHANYPLWVRLENAVVTYAVYLGKTIYPVGLAALYPLMPNGWPPGQVIAAGLLLAALTAGAILLARKQPFLLTGWFWYLGMLVPMAGILQTGDAAYADRYTYLPQIGLWLAGTWSVAEVARERRGRIALGATGAAIVCVFAVMACRQTTYWQDSAALWSHTLDCTTGNYTAHNNLGNVLDEQGREADALAQYREAVRINSADPDAHANYARLLFKEGDTPDAMAQYQEALQIDPSSAPIHEYYGMDLFRIGRVDDATAQFRQSLQIDPNYGDAHTCLGNIMLSQGLAGEALAQYRDALQIDPTDKVADAVICKVLIYLFQHGRAQEAMTEARQTLDLVPGNQSLQDVLTQMQAARRGDAPGAIQH
jgi:tetratricopeptide (TPR) repeat protein